MRTLRKKTKIFFCFLVLFLFRFLSSLFVIEICRFVRFVRLTVKMHSKPFFFFLASKWGLESRVVQCSKKPHDYFLGFVYILPEWTILLFFLFLFFFFPNRSLLQKNKIGFGRFFCGAIILYSILTE